MFFIVFQPNEVLFWIVTQCDIPVFPRERWAFFQIFWLQMVLFLPWNGMIKNKDPTAFNYKQARNFCAEELLLLNEQWPKGNNSKSKSISIDLLHRFLIAKSATTYHKSHHTRADGHQLCQNLQQNHHKILTGCFADPRVGEMQWVIFTGEDYRISHQVIQETGSKAAKVYSTSIQIFIRACTAQLLKCRSCNSEAPDWILVTYPTGIRFHL